MWWLIGGIVGGCSVIGGVAWLCTRDLRKARKARRHPDSRRMRKPLTHAERVTCANLQLLFESDDATDKAAERERAQRQARGTA